MKRGHVTINGLPYMMPLTPDGHVIGATAERLTGPWATQISQGPREYHDMTVGSVVVWEALTGGVGQYKGRDLSTYRRGTADTRSGDAVLPPKVYGSVGYSGSFLPTDANQTRGITWIDIGSEDEPYYNSGMFSLAATLPIQTLGVLVRRVPTADYSGAGIVTVEMRDGGGAPFSSRVTATLTAWAIERPGEWYWLPATAATYSYCSPGPYFIRVNNPSGPSIQWAAHATGTLPPTYYKVNHVNTIDGPVRDILRFTGYDRQERLLAGVNNKVVLWEPSTQTWQHHNKFLPATVRDLQVFSSSQGSVACWVALGGSTTIWAYTGGSPGGAWIEGRAGAQVLAVHDRLLWRAENHEVSASFDGIAWGAKVACGHAGEPVIDMVSQEGQLLARTRGAIFAITYDTIYPGYGGSAPIATTVVNLETDPSPHNKPTMKPWGAGVLFPTWYDLVQYQSGMISQIGIARGQAVADSERRQVYHLHPTGRGVYAAMSARGGAYGMVYQYQQLAYEGGGAGWHPLFHHSTQFEEVEVCYLTPDSYEEDAGRLWFGAGWGLQYMKIPLWTPARWLWGSADYEPSGWVEYSPNDTGKAALVKDWIKVRARVQNATPSRQVGIQYQLGDPMATGSWQTLGSVASSGITDLFFPSSTYGYSITLKAGLSSTSKTQTPVLEALELWYQDILPPLEPIYLTLELKDQQILADGSRDPRTVGEQWADLRALRNYPEGFQMTDELGETFTVRLSEVSRQVAGMERETMAGAWSPVYRVQVHLMRVQTEADAGGNGVS